MDPLSELCARNAAARLRYRSAVDAFEEELKDPLHLREHLAQNPWLGVGAAVGSGVALGALFSGASSDESSPASRSSGSGSSGPGLLRRVVERVVVILGGEWVLQRMDSMDLEGLLGALAEDASGDELSRDAA